MDTCSLRKHWEIYFRTIHFLFKKHQMHQEMKKTLRFT